ncbi:hypothetical protein [Calothrix sp. CCY 0018]|uniref:hypothetical protein n=1 Tax=Calothrix sp. CCY 0018 TaxID=3103864 RepID=UPI0039C68EB2
MLKEKLKKQIDNLNEEQLKKLAAFISSTEFQSEQIESLTPSQDSTPAKRAAEFRGWVSQLPSSGVSLADEALSRDSIYEE